MAIEKTSETHIPMSTIGQKTKMVFALNKYVLDSLIIELIGNGYIVDSVCRVSPFRESELSNDSAADYLIIYRLNLLMA